ncbi:MAG: S4 domain-containing protein, partial [Bacilli bacterium]
MRLDKFVSYALNISRSDSRHIIGAGRIKVNGRIVMKSDFSVDETRDAVDFDDERLAYRRFLYFMLNKPRGYVTST